MEMELVAPDEMPMTLGELCLAIDEGRVPSERLASDFEVRAGDVRRLRRADRWPHLSLIPQQDDGQGDRAARTEHFA